jgi:Ca2+-binding RTX toxin-like protein
MAITYKAGKNAPSSGIDFNKYIESFLPDISGQPAFYGDDGYKGDQIVTGYATGGNNAAKNKLVSLWGEDFSYVLATHELVGTIESIDFGTYGKSKVDSNGNLKGYNTELTISGFSIDDSDDPSSGDVIYALMGWATGAADGTALLQALKGEAQKIIGSEGNDRWTGTKFDDTANGKGGNDNFSGGKGNDTLVGGAGNDTLKGGAGDDKLKGGAGNDKLDGGNGNDMLEGGAGKDVLTGGAGKDDFVFKKAADLGSRSGKTDVITDFSVKDDTIDFSGIDANTKKSGDQAFKFDGKGDLSGKAGSLVYQFVNGNTVVLGDLDGDGKADIALDLNGKIKLTAADFEL